MEIKIVGIDEELKVGDQLRFILDTYDGSGCLIEPYQIIDVTLYFISREFIDPTASEYEAEFINPELEDEYRRLKSSICIKSKNIVRVASTSSIILSGLQEIDGVTLSEGDRVLVKDQISASHNGIYIASSGVWRRSDDAQSKNNLISGIYVFAEEGILNSGKGWVLEAESPIKIGSTELKFIAFADNFNPTSPEQKGMEEKRRLSELEVQIRASRIKSPFFYKDAVIVKKFGGSNDSLGEFFPAWLNPDSVPSELKSKVSSDNIIQRVEDSSGVVFGKFLLEWSSYGAREGDYFVCWTWRPTMGSETLSAHHMFYLSSDSNATSSIPTHRSKQDKYEILLDRYLPEMFKTKISNSDLSPEILLEFNKAVAKGFMFIENQASAVIDLLDSNSTQEHLLPLLSNMFNLKVKSSDSTLWRRQIKKAIPNFKKKGSIEGLREAMSDAGMKLLKLTRLWQVVPKYTNQEHFNYESNNQFELSLEPILPLDSNFRLWFRGKNHQDWTEIFEVGSSSSSSGHWSESFVEISEKTMTWVGFELEKGDSIRIMYKFRSIPTTPTDEQAKENHIRSLPLMDNRDERLQEYPLKNWNVHLIEEDDENFDVLVPVRHPLSDPIVWGRIRTEFPYSENIYNMEEYNGSKRDSFNPCDIDRLFIDSCGQCASSKFNIDFEADKLSDESIKEMGQILDEYMPFHATPNSLNFWGGINEFIRHNEERIEAIVYYSREDVMLAGEGQHIFSKDVYSEDIDSVRRNLLASMTMISNSSESMNWKGVIKNERTVLLSQISIEESDVFGGEFDESSSGFDSLNVKSGDFYPDPFENGNLLEVLGVSTSYYSIYSIDKSIGVINGTVDPNLVGSVFEYRISNRIVDLNVDIVQHKEIIFNDDDVDFSILGIISTHDINMGLASGDAWKLLFEGKEYIVENILPDGTLLLSEVGIVASSPGWRLIDGFTTIKEGSKGIKAESGYGLVSINSPSSFNPRNDLKVGDYLYFDWSSSPRIHRIRSFQKGTNNFYISNYNEGGEGSEEVKVYRRIMDKKIGQFAYDSPMIVADDNIQVELGISNGVESSMIAENHMLFIDGKYYNISSIDGNEVRLSGPQVLSDTIGEPIEFNIYRFSKENLILYEKQNPPYDIAPERYEFKNGVNRSGSFVISNTEASNHAGMLRPMLNFSNPEDIMSHNERIEYSIEYKEEKK
jgi:hypothetical protein